jgi:probable rRNA maturation factor
MGRTVVKEAKADRVVKGVLKREGRKGIVSVKFVDDEQIRALNRKFRKINRATDVLSFEMGEDGNLGDLIISVDTAGRNAKRFGATLNNEIKRLLIHGTLHLLGYDHKRARDRETMRIKEEEHMNVR